jgi:hypothetical protein
MPGPQFALMLGRLGGPSVLPNRRVIERPIIKGLVINSLPVIPALTGYFSLLSGRAKKGTTSTVLRTTSIHDEFMLSSIRSFSRPTACIEDCAPVFRATGRAPANSKYALQGERYENLERYILGLRIIVYCPVSDYSV